MEQTTPEDLKEAYKSEKDPRVVRRMAAVNMVCMRGKSIRDAADDLMRCPNWVSFWVKRFEEGGIDALRDLPRSGRPPKAPVKKVRNIVSKAGSVTTPKKLLHYIQDKLNVTYDISTVRKIMNRIGMSPKTAQLVHENKAETKEIRRWQRNAKRLVSRLQGRGFATVIEDESFFIHDPKTGRKYRSPKWEPVILRCNGRHRKTVV